MSAFSLRPPDPAAASALARACGVSSTTAQILLHRGIADVSAAEAYLSPRLADLSAPEAMADRAAAADRLAAAVRNKERVAIFGDYDVDGTTSAVILADILEALGGEVVVLVANRFEGGYGFSDLALERVKATGASLLVTCDCGSSDHERLARARAAGLDVIVVDHHLVPAEPLPALAFLNPHRPDCSFPYKGLASAGLAFSLGAAVRAVLGLKLDLRPWLDLVALGTIADVAPLDGDNRKLVRAGLSMLGSPDARPGVVALREIAKVRPGEMLGGVDVAFRLAPRLNAAGRLGDPSITADLLRARTLPSARALAAKIETINQERRAIEAKVTSEAIAQVREIYGDQPESGVVAVSEGWHRGVVGISAARLVDRFGVPAIVVAIDGGVGHGSCRAPEGFDLYEAVARGREELIAFGGHRAAAGLSIEVARVDGFRAAFAAASPRGARETEGKHYEVDITLAADGYRAPPRAELARLEPLGERNREPLYLMEAAELQDVRTVGEGHLRATVEGSGLTLSGFGFELADRAKALRGPVHVLGHLRPDTYRGGDAIELRLVELLAAE